MAYTKKINVLQSKIPSTKEGELVKRMKPPPFFLPSLTKKSCYSKYIKPSLLYFNWFLNLDIRCLL